MVGRAAGWAVALASLLVEARAAPGWLSRSRKPTAPAVAASADAGASTDFLILLSMISLSSCLLAVVVCRILAAVARRQGYLGNTGHRHAGTHLVRRAATGRATHSGPPSKGGSGDQGVPDSPVTSEVTSEISVDEYDFVADGAADGAAGTVGCTSGLRPTSLEHAAGAHHAWAPINWRTVKLRIRGYRRHKRKGPTPRPLLPCCGVDLLQGEHKVFSDGLVDAACLPPEIAAAAAEPWPVPSRPLTPADESGRDGSGRDGSARDGSAPPDSTGGDADANGPPAPAPAPALPHFLAVSISMPRYSGPNADGPNVRYQVFHRVPPGLRSDAATSPAARMLCEFLDAAHDGHAKPGDPFYDRFKVIVRMCSLDGGIRSPFLRKMVDWFNGKPMLWRFFGVWGDCTRRGHVVFLNLDFCTGGRLKNAAFSEGAKGLDSATFDMGWTLEARTDDEMPEVHRAPHTPRTRPAHAPHTPRTRPL